MNPVKSTLRLSYENTLQKHIMNVPKFSKKEQCSNCIIFNTYFNEFIMSIQHYVRPNQLCFTYLHAKLHKLHEIHVFKCSPKIAPDVLFETKERFFLHPRKKIYVLQMKSDCGDLSNIHNIMSSAIVL